MFELNSGCKSSSSAERIGWTAALALASKIKPTRMNKYNYNEWHLYFADVI
jgi:hypothetical protein